MVEIDTTRLLQQARDGSDEALDGLLQRHAGKLLAVVRVRLGPSLRGRVASGDVLQECLIKAYRRFGQFEGEDIIAVSRTAHDDGLGGAHDMHDANYLTFHRVRDFRKLQLAADTTAAPSLKALIGLSGFAARWGCDD